MVNRDLTRRKDHRLVSNLRRQVDESPGLQSFRRGDEPVAFDFWGKWGGELDIMKYGKRLTDIADETGTFIYPTKNGKALKIWGRDDDVKAAKTHVANINYEATHGRQKDFAKYFSYSYKNTIQQQILEADFFERLKFKKTPSMAEMQRDMKFAAFHVVQWKLDETPTDLLGSNLGLIDPIRMECKVYIIVTQSKSTKLWNFLILGEDEAGCQRASNRIIKLQQNLLASEPPSVAFYLVKPTQLRQSIMMFDYVAPPMEWNGKKIAAPPTKLAVFEFDNQSPALDCEWGFATEISELDPGEVVMADPANTINAQYIELWFTKIMANMPNYNGSLKMRASIGTCTFDLFPRKESIEGFSIDFFRQMLKDRNQDKNGLSARFASELGDSAVEERLFNSFNSRLDYVHQHDLSSFHDRKPGTLLSFVVEAPEGRSPLKLEVEFPTPTSTGNVQWFQMPRPDHDVLSVNILDLQKVNYSYNLLIQRTLQLSETEVVNLPKSYHDYARSIKFDPRCEIFLDNPDFTKPLFIDDKHLKKDLGILSIEQRRIWTFQFRKTDYLVDLHLLQKIKCERDGNNYKHIPNENRWAVEVHHKLWDEKLAQNQSLRIGKGAKWKPTESEFFPPFESIGGEGQRPGQVWERGSGSRELLRVLDELVDIMRDSA
jgi:hypothetical protein